MIKDLMRGLFASIFVFLALGALGFLILDQVATPSILDRSVTQISAPIAEGADPFAIDGSSATQGQFDTYLEDIADGLFKWIIWLSGLGVLATLLWFGCSLVLQRRVVGPAGQSSAFPAWVALAVIYLVGCLVVYLFVIVPLGINDSMDDTAYFAAMTGGVALGLLSYWIATALAATPVMKPSVPLATWKRGN